MKNEESFFEDEDTENTTLIEIDKEEQEFYKYCGVLKFFGGLPKTKECAPFLFCVPCFVVYDFASFVPQFFYNNARLCVR
jgi:hypothetical protein